MIRPLELLRDFLKRDNAQDLLEYAMLVALICIVAIGAVNSVGQAIKTVFWDAIAASNI